MPSSRVILVGAFVLGGLLLFAVGLFMIGERRMLFEQQFEVVAEFRTLSGLQNGASVRVAGMNAGEVIEIAVPRGPAGRFRVRMRVREDLHPLVRTDSVATIQTEGVVGNKLVQIEAGSEQAPAAPAGSTIPTAEPFDIADLLQQTADTVDTVRETVLALSADIKTAVNTVTETAANANQLVTDVGVEVRAIMKSGSQIARDTQRVIEGVQAGRGTLGRLVKDDELYRRAVQIAEEAQRTMANVREATQDARGAIAELRRQDGPAQGVMADFRETLHYTREAMADLAENAEALKRNFLFRGFFNRRGYFDLNDLSVAQYREGVLETRDRRMLRIWLSSEVLFATDANGGLVLTEGGRARVESAMAAFLPYVRNNPLVVEGYATEGSSGERFLRSRARGGTVLDYAIRTFGLDARRAAVMPLGEEAPGSPHDGRWDGVALAVFVPKTALARLNDTRDTAGAARRQQ